jgi:hypothetical protein
VPLQAGNEKEGDAKEGDENGKAIVTVEAVDAKIAAVLDKGETLSSDSDEDAPGEPAPRIKDLSVVYKERCDCFVV